MRSKWLARLAAVVTVLVPLLSTPLFWVSWPEPGLERHVRGAVFPEDGTRASDWSSRVLSSLEGMAPRSSREDLKRILRVVEVSARRFQVDPLMVLAVIQVESRFDPHAVSPDGAMGLMQLRPETAQEVAAQLGLPWSSGEGLFDPELNILLGTWYLKALVDRFEDLDAALAAFNQGPGRILLRHELTGAVPLAYPDRVWDVWVDLRAEVHPEDASARRIS